MSIKIGTDNLHVDGCRITFEIKSMGSTATVQMTVKDGTGQSILVNETAMKAGDTFTFGPFAADIPFDFGA